MIYIQVELAEAQLNYIIGQTDTLLHTFDDPTSWDREALKDISNPKHQLSEITKVYLTRYRETLERSKQEIDNRISQLEYERDMNQSVYSDSSFNSIALSHGAIKSEAKEKAFHMAQLRRGAELEAFIIERDREQRIHIGRQSSPHTTVPIILSPSGHNSRSMSLQGIRSPRQTASPRSRSDSPAIRSSIPSSRTSSPQHSPKPSTVTPRQHRDHFTVVRKNFLNYTATSGSRCDSPGIYSRPPSALSYAAYVDQHPLSYSLTARQMKRPASVPASEFCSSMLR